MAPDVFLARQPIFDVNFKVVGYELLYRSSRLNLYEEKQDPDRASASTIMHTLTTFGIEKLTRGRRVFINFTRDMLLSGQAEILPPGAVVVELLEDMLVDSEVLAACRDLRQKGYQIALDDFELTANTQTLLRVADIVKVDFRTTTHSERERIRRASQSRELQFLAEKIETWDEFRTAKDEGYTQFQGYFYSRPEMLRGRGLHVTKMAAVRLMSLAAQPEIDLDAVEELFSREVEYSYRLLRYINSAAFAIRESVRSLRQALVLIGESGIRRFASLLAMTILAADKPHELVVSSMVRARMCELIASHVETEHPRGSYFMTGLFSSLDALLDQPMDAATAELALAPEIREALLGEPGHLKSALDLTKALELADWDQADRHARDLGLSVDGAANTVWDALSWAQEVETAV